VRKGGDFVSKEELATTVGDLKDLSENNRQFIYGYAAGVLDRIKSDNKPEGKDETTEKGHD
jgi:hypothetical protein